ncbi:MAG TPA: PP2C family protein-serine/threonine phosphatase, partial [Pyrinomonadaceae bacterium]|nr:PP2C family protein-serine/threonine phosphatase [Pyrinomonadaceae bacterium]
LTVARMEKGSFGTCEECLETIKRDRLVPDALARYRLARLTPDQLDALQRDLDLAWQIQGGLLPKRNLSFCSWEVGFHYEAAGPVSGDFCDLVRLDGGDLFFLLGDVSGKGIAASVLMAHLHAIFRSLVTLGLPLGELVERANRVFGEFTMSTHFATLVCGRVSRFGEMEICNAGHCPPLLVRGGEVTSIEATGLPVGMFCCGRYGVRKVQLSVTDRLFLYTDGLSEARDASGVEYGTARLSRLLSEQHKLPSQALIGACLEDLGAFQAGTQKADDLTIMAIRRTS